MVETEMAFFELWRYLQKFHENKMRLIQTINVGHMLS